MALKVYTADWVLPVSQPPIRNGVVAIQGSKIVAVGKQKEFVFPSRIYNYEVTDFGSAAILPGFVNVHSHLELTSLRGAIEGLSFRNWLLKVVDERQKLDERMLKYSAAFGACEAARSGITTLADVTDSGASMDAMLAVGLRGIVFQEVLGPNPIQAESIIENLIRKLRKLSGVETSLVSIGISPHSPYTVSTKLFELVAELVSAEKIPVAIHAAESKAEVEFVRNNTGDFADSFRRRGLAWQAQNRSVISYLESTGILKSRPLLIHVVQADLEDYNLIAESGSSIAHCPKSNAKLGHGRADLSAILRAGIRVGIGTDSVASNNTCDLIDEARFCSLIHSAAECDPQKWSAKRMIEMMTIRGAEALGMQDKIGTLEPGKEADLVVIPLNAAHLSPVNDIEATILFSARGQDVKMTVVSGKEIFSDDSIRTVDERELFEIF